MCIFFFSFLRELEEWSSTTENPRGSTEPMVQIEKAQRLCKLASDYKHLYDVFYAGHCDKQKVN